jgi:gamma-glutamyl:cysteine ligase YbdK (ATP-grasp superfamily)
MTHDELVRRVCELEHKLAMAERDGAALAAALRSVPEIADLAHDAWQADRDSRVGKLLNALAGRCRGYRADTDAIHETIALHARTPGRSG